MAPRKTAKIVPELQADPVEPAPKAPKAPARPRSKAALAKPVAASVVPEAAAPAPKTRKPRAAAKAPLKAVAEVPAPEPANEAAPVPVPVAKPRPVAAAALLTDQAQAVLQAIQAGRAVELLFVDADNNPPRTFEPRQLIFDAFAKEWYVWGWDRRYNAERHHRLDLIAQVNDVEGVGRAAQGPYKEDTPANQIGGWLGGEGIRVKAVLLKQWIFAVRQAPAPFPEFKIEDLEEGKAQVTFTATDLRAISRWVMQFGDGIQILEPQRLLDRVKQVGIAWGGKPAAAASPAPAQAQAPAKASQPRPERSEHRKEHKPDHHRQEARPEQSSERRKPEQPRHQREAQDNPKPAKPGKVEIRFDRL